ncbi:MAG: adenosylcobalamin-dependent ribonucleoside-diphosphate reductase [Candidatus Thorarchaeota archaeon]
MRITTLKVEKRDKRVVDFDDSKIEAAITKAFESINADTGPVRGLTKEVVQIIHEQEREVIHIEEIQDIVEDTLMLRGFTEIARRYMKYREKHHEARKILQMMGVVDDLKFGPNAATVLSRYLLKDEEGNPTETPSQLFRRVSGAVASIEKKYDKSVDADEYDDLFYYMMASLEFLPNSPTLFNAGTELGQCSACFVLPIEDNMNSIFTSLHHMAIVQKSGGGTGFSFSRLRPVGSTVGTTGGVASGPISFMKVYDTATEIIKQGGRRRGASMAILRCDHPDIMEFIACKSDKASFRNFNISVAITNPFLNALKNDREIELIAPHNKEVIQTISARVVFDAIVHNAWSTGDPGIVFIDRMNEEHPLNGDLIESTNPCGEMPLLPYESCVLGSINLSRMTIDNEINWSRLEEVVRLAVRFLDNIIDLNIYPVKEIEYGTKVNRKIGLGIMGFAEFLIKLEVPYDSVKGLEKAEEVLAFIRRKAERASADLAKIRGNFENFALLKNRNKWKRNASLITIAPTGSISLIAQTSSGIEPLFAIAHSRMLAEGIHLSEVSPLFEKVAVERGFWNDDIEHEVARTGSVQHIEGVPDDVKQVFKAAQEIDPEWHLRMQAAFQKHTDNAVSKCIHEDTLMLTNHGLVSVKECGYAEGNDTFAAPLTDLQVFTGNGRGTERVVAHYSAGSLPATKIRLRNGASLTGATKTHKIQTIDGWKNLGDISVDDLVIVKHRFEPLHTAGQKPIAVDYKLRTNAKTIPLPESMSEGLALWLGMIAADGSLVESTGAVGFHEKNPDIGRIYISLVEKLFNEKPKSREDPRTGVVSHILTSRALVRYTKAIIGNRARDKHVPMQVLQGSAAEKVAFVNGLTLDGYLKGKWGLVVYEGMSKRLAYETAEVLRSFGLPYIYQGSKEIKDYGEVYSVYVSNDLQEIIQPLEVHKRGEARYKKYLVQINPEEVKSLKLPSSHSQYSNLRWLKQSMRNYCWNTVAEELGLQIISPVEKVAHVEDVGEVPLYDIEVDKAHTYLVNGIVSHNTVNLPNSATTEGVEQIFLLADQLQLKGTTVFRDGCLGGVQVLYAGCQNCDS